MATGKIYSLCQSSHKEQLRTLFVDLDGTLADTEAAFFTAYTYFMNSQGQTPSQGEFKSLIGLTLVEIATQLKKKYHLASSESELLHCYRNYICSAYEQASLLPGARNFVEKARECSLALWIVTSAPRDLASSFINKHLLDRLVDGMVTADGLPGKPNPTVYNEALRIAKTLPQQSLAIEDSPQGASAAIAAGIPTVLIHSSEHVPGITSKAKNWDDLALKLAL